MNKTGDTLIILTPAFAEHEGDTWLPAQEALVRMLNRRFPQLRIVILTFHFPAQGPGTYEWYGNEVMAFGGAMKGGWRSPLLWSKVWRQLNRLRRTCNVIGLFSFFCSECAFIGHHFAKRHHLKHHIWILGQDAKAGNKQVRRIKPVPDELIAISDFLVTQFEQSHRIRPAHLIPIGMDTAQFSTEKQTRDIDILGAGSLIPLKQYDLLIRVAAQLSRTMPGLKVMLCGAGPEEAQLEMLAKELRVDAHIRFAGKQEHATLLTIMQRSKVLLHPSGYEGFSVACTEALYAGAHIISFHRPMNQAIPHWHIVQTPEEMAAEAVRLLQDRDLSHEPVLHYRMEDTADRIMALYGYKPASVS